MKKQKSRKPKASRAPDELVLFGRPVSRHQLPPEFHIPDLMPEQILSVAKTPKQHYSAIRNRVESAIVERIVLDRVAVVYSAISKNTAPLRRIVRQTERLLKDVQQLEPDLRRRLTASLTMDEEEWFKARGEFWLPYLGYEVVPFERELYSFAILAKRAAAKPKRTISHRPHFSGPHTSLLSLVGKLHDLIVDEAGGKLTLWEHAALGALKGTLPTILQILRPIVPHTIPDRQKLNYSTLSRILRQVKNPKEFESLFSTK